MSVTNGQAASATVFNNAFVSRTQNTGTVGVLNLNNTTDVNSGNQIINTQRAINEIFDAVGMTGEGDGARNTYLSNNVVVNGTSRKLAISALDAAFDPVSGHSHDGANSAQVSASDLLDLNYYKSQWQAFDLLTASGTSTDVSSTFTLETPGGGVSTEGVVTSPPYNKCELRSKDTGTYVEDAQGQRVYARLTESAGTWTLSYFTNEAGVETAHTLSSQDLTVSYRKVFNLANVPTFNEDAGLLASLDLTADIIDATETLAGKVLLSNIVATSIGSTNVKGTSARVSHEDHQHQGIHAIQEFTEAVNVFGDIVLKSGTGITITRTGQTFEVAASGGSGANTALSNLITTAINQDLIFNKLTPVIQSGNNLSGATEDITLRSGDASAGNASGGVILTTGSSDTFSGYVGIYTANVGAGSGSSGVFDFITGDCAGTGDSGYVIFETGTSSGSSGNSGYFEFRSGDCTATTGDSGYFRAASGNSTNGASGDVIFETGNAGTTRGLINFNNYIKLKKTTNTANVWGGDFIGFGVNGANTDISTVSFGSGMFLEEGSLYLGMITGDITSGATTTSDVWIATGYQTDTGNSGAITIQVGDSANATSGIITLRTGAGDTGSGGINLETGNSASGGSGNIALVTGTASTLRGSVIIDARTLQLPLQTSAPGSPNAGDMYFDTTTNKSYTYDGTTWQAHW